MRTSTSWRRAIIALLGVTLINTGFVHSAQAGIIQTSVVVRSTDSPPASIAANELRERVRVLLAQFGVEGASIDKRLAVLSDSELSSLAKHIPEAPAGSGVLVVFGVAALLWLLFGWATDWKGPT